MNIQLDEEAVASLYGLQHHFSNLPLLHADQLSDRDMIAVVDMINGFCRTGNLKSDRCLALAQPIAEVLQRIPCRRVFICDKHEKHSAELAFFPEHCTDEIEINVVDELIDFAETVVYKNSTNAFFPFMRDIQIDKAANYVIMVGVCTDICVLQFALTLRAFFNELNYPVEVALLTELTDTYDGEDHSARLLNLLSLKLIEENGVKLYRNIE